MCRHHSLARCDLHAWGTLGDKAQVLFIWPVLDPFAAGRSTYLQGKPPTVA